MAESVPVSRVVAIALTTEPDPRFCYGQHLTLKRGTGKIIGLEYISQETREKHPDLDKAPESGWHYSFGHDKASAALHPIELFSEAQLIQAIAQS